MKVLSREDLLNKELQLKEIEISELNGSVFVRGLSSKEQLEYEDACEQHKDDEKPWRDGNFWKIQKCLYGADKKLLFPEESDLEVLKELPESVLVKMHYAITRLTQIPDFDEFVKKCGWAAIEDFSSDSALPSESTTPIDSTNASA